MKILALDTACAACSAAVLDAGAIRAERFEPMERGQTEALMPMVAAVMAEAGLAFAALDLVAVTVGPGSFTGLRTGLAAARGIALGSGARLAGVTTLEAVAHAALGPLPEGAPAPGRIVVALSTGRAELYVQSFDRGGTALDPPSAALPADVLAGLGGGPLLLAGDGAQRLIEAAAGSLAGAEIARGPGLPHAAWVARIADARWGTNAGALPDAQPRPLYLYPPRATRASTGRSVAQ